jgi:N-acetylglutamate synthase-like GNAT family acetyltransferase
MTFEGELFFSHLNEVRGSPALARLLDSAFKAQNYVQSFPHIFSSQSSAQIFAGRDRQQNLLAVCAVDTEVWSEPHFLRGACLGSVAVEPACQGKGVGRRFLSWVVDEVRQQARHDFIYLFSDQPEFYESLGFIRIGEEILCEPLLQELHHGSRRIVFRPPVLTQHLNEHEILRLWPAFESGRRTGESHSSFSKFQLAASIPNMIVSWIEDEGKRIVGGCFVGKGIDFQGVAHSFFAESDEFLRHFWEEFIVHLGPQVCNLQVAGGMWSGVLSPFLKKKSAQHLCLVYEFANVKNHVQEFLHGGRVYPRALFSS